MHTAWASEGCKYNGKGWARKGLKNGDSFVVHLLTLKKKI